ncbi:hypothetical protein BKP45_10690 [Anaerobacillus alkalidiazotrophicus]|uniref:Uncharacterized protein n=1 Tax=Anaerobacillus alkalidiazotrophicus TaxID=472963 RepID=A0A1S2M4W4_9BACI|nr:hypothetical protein [Anaerobacillus alkalidiazotrophicus]OIJ18061.1 hypothetical protein BKP45_16405 [Anaerobacillus alkalidiazotrophicus]OIJ19540.1 hypothetical protein BKP45_10690 [Anaerobacillus alkalidiazotrophicus]
MKKYEIRYLLYFVAVLWFISLIFIPLMSEVTISVSLTKVLVSIPFLLVIIGKILAIIEKRNKNKSLAGDVGINIGLTIALLMYLLSV